MKKKETKEKENIIAIALDSWETCGAEVDDGEQMIIRKKDFTNSREFLNYKTTGYFNFIKNGVNLYIPVKIIKIKTTTTTIVETTEEEL